MIQKQTRMALKRVHTSADARLDEVCFNLMKADPISNPVSLHILIHQSLLNRKYRPLEVGSATNWIDS